MSLMTHRELSRSSRGSRTVPLAAGFVALGPGDSRSGVDLPDPFGLAIQCVREDGDRVDAVVDRSRPRLRSGVHRSRPTA